MKLAPPLPQLFPRLDELLDSAWTRQALLTQAALPVGLVIEIFHMLRIQEG